VLVSGALCGPLVTFSPVLVKTVFHGSAGQFSAAIAAFGLGGLLGACGLLAVVPQRDRRRISWACACVHAAIVVLAAAAPRLWGLAVLLVAAGASMSATNTAANTFLLSSVDARLRGQTVSLYMLAMRGGASLGSLMTGLSVGLLGTRQALALNGVLAIGLQVLIARLYRFRLPH
jgi:predicted MFS family arabinose efflux permease